MLSKMCGAEIHHVQVAAVVVNNWKYDVMLLEKFIMTQTFSVSKLTFKPNTIGFRDKITWTPGLVEKCFNLDEIK